MNKVILMGRLTKDPELRYTSNNNTAVCSFSLAVDRRFSKPGEEKKTDFFNIVAWRNQAEFCSKYFTKGQRVVVVGNLQNRSWDDNEGRKHYITEVIAEEVYFADSRRNEGEASFRPSGSASFGEPQPEGYFPTDDDDELPF